MAENVTEEQREQLKDYQDKVNHIFSRETNTDRLISLGLHYILQREVNSQCAKPFTCRGLHRPRATPTDAEATPARH